MVKVKLEKSITSSVIIGCVHLEKVDKKALNATLNYIHDNNFDNIILAGDILDFPSLQKDKLKQKYYRVDDSLLKTKELLKNFLTKSLPSKPVKYFLKGNHEVRLDKYANLNPEIYEYFAWEYVRHTWYPNTTTLDHNEVLKIGNAQWLHGFYYGSGHIKKMIDAYGPNTYYFHTHTVELAPKPVGAETNAPLGGSFGTLEKILPDWRKGRPHNWTNAFATMYTDKSSGNFNLYPHIITNGKFIAPGGKKYSG